MGPLLSHLTLRIKWFKILFFNKRIKFPCYVIIKSEHDYKNVITVLSSCSRSLWCLFTPLFSTQTEFFLAAPRIHHVPSGKKSALPLLTNAHLKNKNTKKIQRLHVILLVRAFYWGTTSVSSKAVCDKSGRTAIRETYSFETHSSTPVWTDRMFMWIFGMKEIRLLPACDQSEGGKAGHTLSLIRVGAGDHLIALRSGSVTARFCSHKQTSCWGLDRDLGDLGEHRERGQGLNHRLVSPLISCPRSRLPGFRLSDGGNVARLLGESDSNVGWIVKISKWPEKNNRRIQQQ